MQCQAILENGTMTAALHTHVCTSGVYSAALLSLRQLPWRVSDSNIMGFNPFNNYMPKYGKAKMALDAVYHPCSTIPGAPDESDEQEDRQWHAALAGATIATLNQASVLGLGFRV